MNGEKKRILIVDDEEDLTWSISMSLARNGHALDITCTNSGNSALELLSHDRYDLVVTDLRMPGVNGIQLVDVVRMDYPQTHVIVMTAYGSREVREFLERWQSIGYIEKPFEFEELRNLIYTFLEERECV